MKLRPRLKAAVFALLLAAAATCLLAAPSAAATPDPADVATSYLQARAAATTSGRPTLVLAPYVVPDSALAVREARVARGAGLRQADLGHLVDDVSCDVAVTSISTHAAGDTAGVTAHVITTVTWHAARGRSVEARGVDHALALRRVGGAWRVIADVYADVEAPAALERGGAPPARVRAAARRIEAEAACAGQAAAVSPAVALFAASVGRTGPDAPTPAAKGYMDRIAYDREAVRAYADKYALSYNPTYVRFTADCCNFVSQSTVSGNMPMALGDWMSGWWYDKRGTGSPSDDRYSWSWISCSRQIAFWLGTRIDWVSSISSVGKGDVIYYDWTGDGSWDHVAVLVGTNSLKQKVIDAHTTDHYRVYWKLGNSATRYKFGRVKTAWVA